jgi:hypothetical protein
MFNVLVRKHVTEAIVRPPYEFISRNELFKVKNHTAEDIIVTVPDVFETSENGRTASGGYTVNSGDTLELTVRSNAPTGAYSYSIFCNETHSYAQANSDPEFIVE